MKSRGIAGVALLLFLLTSCGRTQEAASTFRTPGDAIHGYARVHHLKATGKTKIQPGSYQDRVYGQQFIVEGYEDPETGGELRFFYLKQDNDGFWYVTSAGTGP